ncbi:MAG: MogA/MoaB family molybdenum cofactor biosynthesis protein [bacterium]
MPIRLAILTLSDKGARGEREDESGPLIRDILSPLGVEVVRYEVIPDELDLIEEKLKECSDVLKVDMICTTGGTGVSPRDVTPEATLAVIDRQIPGMSEAMRLEGLKSTPRAMISRGVCGIRGRTLIVNLPGSPRGVRENLSVLVPVIPHILEKMRGDGGDCATL